MRRLISFAVFIGLFWGHFVMAAETDNPETLIKKNFDTVLSILSSQQLDADQKTTAILDTVSPLFDFSLMAKLTLGRKYWPDLSKTLRDQFTDLFVKLLKDLVLGKLTLYTDEQISYGKASWAKNKVQVPTFLISKDNKISMMYKLYRSKTGWHIYDVEIQGISLILTYRSQFDQILKKGTFEDLLLKMEESAEGNTSQIDVTDIPIMKQE